MILHSSLFWLLAFLLFLLILRGLYSLGLRIAKEKSMSDVMLENIRQREINLSRWTRSAVFGLSCFIGGWLARDLNQFHHTYIVNGVDVIDNSNREAGRYVLAYADTHLEFDTTFCPDYIPQFPIGVRLEVLVYEDRGACWSISNKKLGYKVRRGENDERQRKTATR